MASAHCHIHYYPPTLFSLVQVYASELVNSISVRFFVVFFSFLQRPKQTLLLNYRETKGRVGEMV